MTQKKIVFSGIRPTGHAHLGNYAGAMSNWVSMMGAGRKPPSVPIWIQAGPAVVWSGAVSYTHLTLPTTPYV